ncbi:MAG TPA: DUF6638 family protein [Roseiflexaceae bacterium]|nr:DUF6638 family protein [Roseiflexaceae bacterium]
MARLPWHGPLFPVAGLLAERYAKALEQARGLDCPLDRFSVDRMGWSPQLAALFGEDYLGADALRSAIVLSPEQAEAPPLRRRFSYEAALIELIYLEAKPTLLHLIASEAALVELDGGLTFCRVPSDLLGITSALARIDTPSGTLDSTRDLLDLALDLGERSRLLDDGYIDQMLALVAKVGDPRRRTLPPDLHLPVGSLWADLVGAGPAYVLRPERAQPIVIAARPDPGLDPARSTVLALDDPAVIGVLLGAGFLHYRQTLDQARRRLGELEIDALLGCGEQPDADLNRRRRQIVNSPAVRQALPPLYWELDGVHKRLSNGGPLEPEQLSLEARWALALPTRDADVMGHLMARFIRYDYRLLAQHLRRDVQFQWSGYSEAKQRYLERMFPYIKQGFVQAPEAAAATEQPDEASQTAPQQEAGDPA